MSLLLSTEKYPGGSQVLEFLDWVQIELRGGLLYQFDREGGYVSSRG